MNIFPAAACLLMMTTVVCGQQFQPGERNLTSKGVPVDTDDLQNVIIDFGRQIIDNCPPLLCTGLDCSIVTERNGCQLCACPIGSPARGCDPMPIFLWHDLMRNGCPAINDPGHRDEPQKVHRWFRRVNRFHNTDDCEPYVFPYCVELDYNLWRSPRTKQECEFYCYSFGEQKARRQAKAIST